MILSMMVYGWDQAMDRFMDIAEFFGSMKRFVDGIKREYAKYIFENGDANQRKRALIYLRTKNKRIKKKQWKEIDPW